MKLINLITGYEKVGNVPDGEKKKSASRRFFKRRLSGSISTADGNFTRLSRKLFSITSYTNARSYGAFILSFAVITMLLSSGANFVFIKLPGDTRSFIIGVCALVLSLSFFFFDGTVASALERHKHLGELVFEFFCIKRPVKSEDTVGIPIIVCIALGIVLAVLGFFTSTYIVALVIVGVVFAYLSFVSPEFSLFSCILALPTVSLLGIHDYIACFVAAVMLLSFARKVIFGKRTYNFEQYDIILALMMLFVLISGILVGGAASFKFALVIIASTSVYFTTGNLITNPRLLDCMIKSFIFSSLIPCIVGCVQFSVMWAREGFLSTVTTGISATFGASDSFSCFLIMPICFAFMYARQRRSVFYSFIFLLNCAVLLMCGNFFAPIAILLAVLAYSFIKNHKLAIIPVLILVVLPYLLTLFEIPEQLSVIIGDDIVQTVKIWEGSWQLLKDNWLIGIGLGSEAFSDVLSLAISFNSPDARNVFLDMAVKSGVVTAALFALLLTVRLAHRASYRRFLGESSVASVSATSAITITAFIIFGTFTQMFTEITLYYIFFSAFAMGSATLRIACEEHDDRLAYLRDARQSYSAAVDVDLNGFVQH